MAAAIPKIFTDQYYMWLNLLLLLLLLLLSPKCAAYKLTSSSLRAQTEIINELIHGQK